MERKDQIRDAVREHYAEVARSGERECECAPSCCTDPSSAQTTAIYAERLGYSEAELASLPRGAEMGLGCGNPTAIASLREGEVVLDLGSGGGIDCFLAARRVGPSGRVIGVDITEEMVDKARRNAEAGGHDNVEFRLGKIEEIPADRESVDVIISNCVINLSPDKEQVFREAFRVLKPGGRLAISDIVAYKPLPEEIRRDANLYSCCISGAATVDDLTRALESAGFEEINIDLKEESREFIENWLPGSGVENLIVSATIEATRPGE